MMERPSIKVLFLSIVLGGGLLVLIDHFAVFDAGDGMVSEMVLAEAASPTGKSLDRAASSGLVSLPLPTGPPSGAVENPERIVDTADPTGKFFEAAASMPIPGTQPPTLRDFKNDPHPNLILIKTHKTGGTTLAGVLRRLGRNFGLHDYDMGHFKELPGGKKIMRLVDKEPGVFASHTRYRFKRKLLRALHGPTFLVTIVRHPGERCRSRFYHFFVSRGRKSTVELYKSGGLKGETKIKHFREECEVDYFKETVCDQRRKKGRLQSNKECLGLYDLVAVNERFDESLIVMMHLLGLPMRHLWYTSAKVASSGVKDDKGAEMLPKPRLSAEPAVVRQFFETEFPQENAEDYAFVAAANRRLDEHIERIGRTVVEREVADLKAQLAAVHASCGSYSVTSEEDCLFHDEACAYKCLDAFELKANGTIGSR